MHTLVWSVFLAFAFLLLVLIRSTVPQKKDAHLAELEKLVFPHSFDYNRFIRALLLLERFSIFSGMGILPIQTVPFSPV
jgi:hypothetical protein